MFMCESTYIVLHVKLHIVWTKTLLCGCFFYAKVQRPVWGRPESVAQRKKLLPAPSAPLSLSRGLPLPQRGVKLTVTVISRFVGRTVSVPRLGQPVRCSSPFLASLSTFSSVLWGLCKSYNWRWKDNFEQNLNLEMESSSFYACWDDWTMLCRNDIKE